MLKLHSKCKRNLIFTFFFLLGLIGLKSHPFLVFIAILFLTFNLLKVIQEYNQTRIEAKQIKNYLQKNWEQKKVKKTII
jgi:hypothetical protein